MAENRIIVQTPLRGGDVNTVEGIASEDLTPGHLIEPGGSDDYQKHSTANGRAQGLIALKAEPNGGIGDTINSGDTVTLAVPPKNTRINGLLDSSSTDISEGDALESNGDGTLVKHGDNTDASETEDVVGYAAEDVTSPGSGTTRIQYFSS